MTALDVWLGSASLALLAAMLVGGMAVAAVGGHVLRRWLERGREPSDDAHEGYVVTAVLGLLALLIGFTFSQAVSRYDVRRLLVIDEANTIGTAYLRAGLLEEPHRGRIQSILVRYTDNRVTLGEADPRAPGSRALLETNDRLVAAYWDAISEAFPTVRDSPFSVSLVENANHLVDLDASRKAARRAKVPATVYAVLYTYALTTAAILGYVLSGLRGRLSGAVFLVLLALCLLLIFDIDRPSAGGVREAQGPMRDLRDSLDAQARLNAAAQPPPP